MQLILYINDEVRGACKCVCYLEDSCIKRQRSCCLLRSPPLRERPIFSHTLSKALRFPSESMNSYCEPFRNFTRLSGRGFWCDGCDDCGLSCNCFHTDCFHYLGNNNKTASLLSADKSARLLVLVLDTVNVTGFAALGRKVSTS